MKTGFENEAIIAQNSQKHFARNIKLELKWLQMNYKILIKLNYCCLK